MKRARAKATTTPGSAATFAGLGLMSAALAWWFSYYSQMGGAAFRLDDKLECLSGDGIDCDHLQQFIGSSFLPAYSPLLLWLGAVVTILGLFLSRWNKA
jgi:hypothetical protein